MKKAIIFSLLAFLASFGGFIYIFKIIATLDYPIHNHLIHGTVMVAVCLVSFFVAYRAYLSYSYSKKVEELFLTLAFYMFGFIFFIHGIFVPGFLFIDELLFDVFEHTGFFLGSLLLLGLSSSFASWKEGIYRKRLKIIVGIIATTIAYFIFIMGTPPIAEYIGSKLDIIIGLSAVCFFLSAIMLLLKYRASMNDLILCFIVGLSILVNIGIIPFFYEEWNILWWYFHILVLVSFLVILVGFLRSNKYNITKNN